MPTYVALLRGINLGPRNKIAMADLRDVLVGLGHGDVRTHILSGNAIFTSTRDDIAGLETELEAAIRDRFEFDIRVLIRTADDLARVVAANPFGADSGNGGLFALFIDRNPDPERLAAIDPSAFTPEAFSLGDRVIYVASRGGLQGSKLAFALTDKRLGVTMTNRNWNTVTRLLEIAQDIDRAN